MPRPSKYPEQFRRAAVELVRSSGRTRDFTAPAPGQRLAGDITYLPTQEGWLYLRTTIDLFNRLDHGSQYSSAQFRATLTALRMRASMGRVGSRYDNAVAESFFASLKAEIGTKVWNTRAEARKDVFAYLTYYNHHRLHSTLKLRTPHEARVCYRQPIALAA